MNTAKDANGVEIQVGDTVRHRLEPAEGLEDGDAVHNFAGSASVVEIIGDAFVVVKKHAGSQIPVYCSVNVVKV